MEGRRREWGWKWAWNFAKTERPQRLRLPGCYGETVILPLGGGLWCGPRLCMVMYGHLVYPSFILGNIRDVPICFIFVLFKCLFSLDSLFWS